MRVGWAGVLVVVVSAWTCVAPVASVDGVRGASVEGVRGTWISTYSCASSKGAMAACVAQLAAQGVNTLYVDAWHNGVAYFESPTARRVIGVAGQGSDLVGWALEAIQTQGLAANVSVHAWFEYGLMVAPVGDHTVFAETAQAEGWVAGTADGFLWMDAANTGALDFLCALMQDARRGYPALAGVQLDDHFSMPASLPNASVAVMTAAARHVSANVSATPGPPLELSPATLTFARTEYSVDWAAWFRDRLFATFTPQIYRLTAQEFDDEFAFTKATLGTTDGWAAGVRGFGVPPTPWPALADMLATARAANVGVVVWDVRAITTVYPHQFKSLWGASAA